MMIDSFVDSGFEMKAVLRTMTKSSTFPSPDMPDIGPQATYMGQDLLNPPSVEGWQTGREWINSGSLLARINFTADYMTDTSLPGVKDIINHMKGSDVTTPDELLDACLEHMGFVELSEETRGYLAEHARSGGDLDWKDPEAAGVRIGETMAMIGATTEYQFG